MSVDPQLAIRLKNAWNALTREQQSLIQSHVDLADQQLWTILRTGNAPSNPAVRRDLLLAKSVITNNRGVVAWTADMAATQNERMGAGVNVDPAGKILGVGKFQELDPGWVEAAALWLEHLVPGERYPFGSATPDPIRIPNITTIALAGDFGTGDFGGVRPAPSTKIRKFIPTLQPHITIHLGDVYYAGTHSSEQGNLVAMWPSGSLGALTLNSNHEMYPGAISYFQEALGSTLFRIQQKRSFFALENDYWIVVGLDSAYYSDPWGMYMDGNLDSQLQLPFLQKYANQGKQVIVLTHHNGLAEDGRNTTGLWSQVMGAFPSGTAPAYWYWGHIHAGVIYTPEAGRGTLCRCIGHGALPWGKASELANNPNVEWYENRPANDPNDPVRVLNGFAVLSLSGPSVTEAFHDENGHLAYPS